MGRVRAGAGESAAVAGGLLSGGLPWAGGGVSMGFQGACPGASPAWGCRWAERRRGAGQRGLPPGWTLLTFCVPGREPWAPLHPWGAPTCSPRSTSCFSPGHGYSSSVQAVPDL